MSREKSPLTREIVFSLGKILTALTSKTMTEDDIRTACRSAGIAALGQGELTTYLRQFRDEIPTTPKDKLAILASIIPEGLLMGLLIVAQESINAQVAKVYQTDVEANMNLQKAQAVLENEKAEALAAVKAKEADCASLSTKLDAAEKVISSLNERLMAAEKENSLLRGRLLEREEANLKKTTAKIKRTSNNAGRSAVKVSIAKTPAAAGGNQPEAGDLGHKDPVSVENFAAAAAGAGS